MSKRVDSVSDQSIIYSNDYTSLQNKNNIRETPINTKYINENRINNQIYNNKMNSDLLYSYTPLEKLNIVTNTYTECEENTKKIDYRYVRKYPISDIINENNIEYSSPNQTYWFTAYGKLMKTKKILKILNYYNRKPNDFTKYIYSSGKYLKEKTLLLNDYTIFFVENSNKPFIKYEKGGTLFVKLYLLTLKEINMIFNYLNRTEYKIKLEKINYLDKKGSSQIINDNENGIILPYNLIYCLGKFMNNNMYSFSSFFDFEHEKINYKLPNTSKLTKLIKIIDNNFQDYSIDDIINYLIPDHKYPNAFSKKNELKNILFSNTHILNKKIAISSTVRDTIKGIPTQSPESLRSYSNFGLESNNSLKNSDLFIKDSFHNSQFLLEKENNKKNLGVVYKSTQFSTQKQNQQNQQNQQNNNSNNNNVYEKIMAENIINKLCNYDKKILKTDSNYLSTENTYKQILIDENKLNKSRKKNSHESFKPKSKVKIMSFKNKKQKSASNTQMPIKDKTKLLLNINGNNLLNTNVEKVNIFVNENYKSNLNKNKIKKIINKCFNSLNRSSRTGGRNSGNKKIKSINIYKLIRKQNSSTFSKKYLDNNKSMKNNVKIKNVFNRVKSYTPSKTTRLLVKHL